MQWQLQIKFNAILIITKYINIGINYILLILSVQPQLINGSTSVTQRLNTRLVITCIISTEPKNF